MAVADGIRLARERLRGVGSTVRITGLSGVGKTRFAQALFETDVGKDALPSANVIYADLGDDISPTASELVSYLIANDFTAYVVLDNCPPDVHRNLQKKVSSNSARLCLLTIEYDISDDRPEETEVIHLEPSSEETVSKLIQKRFPALGRVNANKVAEFAGGNARVHETISDTDLAEILSALNELEGGVFSTLEILGMRFFIDKDSDYVPSEVLRSVGREAIRKLLSMHREDIKKHRWHGLDRVVSECLSISAPDNEVGEISELLCEGVESFRLYSFELTEIIGALIVNFPEMILNRIFTGGKRVYFSNTFFPSHNNLKSMVRFGLTLLRNPLKAYRFLGDFQTRSKNEALLVHSLFNNRSSRHGPSLNLAPVGRLVRWCNGNQDRIQKVAAAVSPYTPTDKEIKPLDNPKQVILSDHIKALLEVAEKPIDIVEIIFKGTWPGGWSGSLADVLEVRSKAFAELLEHPSHEVRNFARLKLTFIEKSIRKNREQEAKENSRREQRFE